MDFARDNAGRQKKLGVLCCIHKNPGVAAPGVLLAGCRAYRPGIAGIVGKDTFGFYALLWMSYTVSWIRGCKRRVDNMEIYG